jgi:hypothetical protein
VWSSDEKEQEERWIGGKIGEQNTGYDEATDCPGIDRVNDLRRTPSPDDVLLCGRVAQLSDERAPRVDLWGWWAVSRSIHERRESANTLMHTFVLSSGGQKRSRVCTTELDGQLR